MPAYAFSGDALRRLIREKGVTTKHVAIATGRSNNAVRSWVLGRAIPRWPILLKICEYLDCEPGDLFVPVPVAEEKSA